jgi:hypothetical protein
VRAEDAERVVMTAFDKGLDLGDGHGAG